MNWQLSSSESSIESGKLLVLRAICETCEHYALSAEYVPTEEDHITVLRCSQPGCSWEGSVWVTPLGWNKQVSIENPDGLKHLEWKFV